MWNCTVSFDVIDSAVTLFKKEVSIYIIFTQFTPKSYLINWTNIIHHQSRYVTDEIFAKDKAILFSNVYPIGIHFLEQVVEIAQKATRDLTQLWELCCFIPTLKPSFNWGGYLCHVLFLSSLQENRYNRAQVTMY